jgi:hypothetical protein
VVQSFADPSTSLAACFAEVLNEAVEPTRQALIQGAAALRVAVEECSATPVGRSRLRGLLRLPGADPAMVRRLRRRLRDPREWDTLERSGQEALAVLLSPARRASTMRTLAARTTVRTSSAQTLLAVSAALALARFNAQRAGLPGLILQRAPPLASGVEKAGAEEAAASTSFDPPPPPTLGSRVLAWVMLAILLAQFSFVTFVL